MAQQYRHVIARNSKKITLNHNLFDVFATNASPDLLAGILNSTFVALSKHQFGRVMGREGNLKTEVIDVKAMLVPDPRDCEPNLRSEIRRVMGDMRKRTTLPLSEELELPDRNALDDAVLNLLGFSESAERQQIKGELYSEMRRIHHEIRQAELVMQRFRRETARQDRASPRTVAEEIWAEFDKSQLHAFPADFLQDGELAETVALPAGEPRILDDLFDRGAVQVDGIVVQLGSKDRAAFAAKMIELGVYGQVRVPKSDRACQRALESYQRYEEQISTTFRELAEERSADPDIQARIARELERLSRAWNRTERSTE
jgi:hypothetical protein